MFFSCKNVVNYKELLKKKKIVPKVCLVDLLVYIKTKCLRLMMSDELTANVINLQIKENSILR